MSLDDVALDDPAAKCQQKQKTAYQGVDWLATPLTFQLRHLEP